MQFQDVVKDLNSSNLNEREISRRIINGMLYVLESSGSVYKPGLIKLLNRTKNVLLKIRKNDSFVSNILNYLSHDLMIAKNVRDEVKRRCISIERHFSFVNKKITEEGSKKIKNNSKIFVLSYSENILNILRKAKIEGKNWN
jgi:translation initiation factor 2B subunit (eIF-2B alpha/beta/delta family)